MIMDTTRFIKSIAFKKAPRIIIGDTFIPVILLNTLNLFISNILLWNNQVRDVF